MLILEKRLSANTNNKKALNKSLKLGVKIISCSTEREKDGLAISTRNKFLNPRQRSAAKKIYFALRELKLKKTKKIFRDETFFCKYCRT